MRAAPPIRIAHVASSDVAIPALMPFCRPLLAAGCQITMITPDGPHVAAGRAAGLAWSPLSLERRLAVRTDVRGTLELAGYFRRGRFDIVHTHNIKAGHIGRVVAAAARVPIVVHTIHGMAYSLDTPPLRRRAHALLERIANLGCDLVLSQSHEDRRTCIATGAIEPARIEVIGNGIDLRRFTPDAEPARRATMRAELDLAPDDVLFVSAGRLIQEKGFVELFEAFARAHGEDRRVQLAVAGPADVRADALPAAALARAQAAGVRLLGERRDMPALYAASDAVVLASWHEGMPRVLMEGAAMGRPLIASDVCGCREVVTHGANGLLTAPRSAASLAEALLRLTRDPGLRHAFAARNLELAPASFSIDAAVARVNAAYARLLARRGRTLPA